jgi:hypothetical protein
MRCEIVQAQLSALLDEELSHSAAEVVERHVRSCGRCSLRFEECRRVKHLLDAMSVPETAAVADRVMAIVSKEKPGHEPLPAAVESRPGRIRSFTRYLVASAALVALLVPGPWADRPDEPQSPVGQLVVTTGGIFDGMGNAIAEAGRGIVTVPERAAESARTAWLDIASNASPPRLSDAVTLSGRLISDELEGVSTMMRQFFRSPWGEVDLR